jgi:predicted kinase
VDANFREDRWRQTFLRAAARWGVPGLFFQCRTDPDTAKARLGLRRGDASDAGWSVYQELARSWEEAGDVTRPALHEIQSGGSEEETLAQALTVLQKLNHGLHG